MGPVLSVSVYECVETAPRGGGRIRTGLLRERCQPDAYGRSHTDGLTLLAFGDDDPAPFHEAFDLAEIVLERFVLIDDETFLCAELDEESLRVSYLISQGATSEGDVTAVPRL